jgi:hypothetical protein
MLCMRALVLMIKVNACYVHDKASESALTLTIKVNGTLIGHPLLGLRIKVNRR